MNTKNNEEIVDILTPYIIFIEKKESIFWAIIKSWLAIVFFPITIIVIVLYILIYPLRFVINKVSFYKQCSKNRKLIKKILKNYYQINSKQCYVTFIENKHKFTIEKQHIVYDSFLIKNENNILYILDVNYTLNKHGNILKINEQKLIKL